MRTPLRREAEAVRARFAARLRRGLGVGGRRLARKRDGLRPLGYSDSSGGIPAELLRGAIAVHAGGFRVSYAERSTVGYFHAGDSLLGAVSDSAALGRGRPPRPIVGLTAAPRREITRSLGRRPARHLPRAIRPCA